MKHTPTPWLQSSATVYALNEVGSNRFFLNVQRGFSNGERTSSEECSANAKLITQCVNHFDALVEALEKVVNSASPHPEENPSMYSAWREARAALKLAKP